MVNHEMLGISIKPITEQVNIIYDRANSMGIPPNYLPEPKSYVSGMNIDTWSILHQMSHHSRGINGDTNHVGDRINGQRPMIASMRTKDGQTRITDEGYRQERESLVFNRGNHDMRDSSALQLAAAEGSSLYKPVIILPHHQEAGSAWGNALYASQFGEVVSVGTGKGEGCRDASDEIRAVGIDTLNQNEIFKRMLDLPDDFTEQTGIISNNGIYDIPGAKGLTLEAAKIWAYCRGMLDEDDRIVISHDTDIVNPEEYAAVEQILAALNFSPDSVQSGGVLRTGLGRNIETNMFNSAMLAQEVSRPDLREVNSLVSRLGWPLTGEFFDKAGQVKSRANMAGMGIETFRNLDNASRQVKAGHLSNIQVCNPAPKRENGDSPSTREFQVIFGCAYNQRVLVHFCQEHGIMPDDLGRIDGLHWLKLWNETIAGRMAIDFPVPVHERNDVPETVTITPDFILPSIDQLVYLGALHER
jgi:hypothetical protein